MSYKWSDTSVTCVRKRMSSEMWNVLRLLCSATSSNAVWHLLHTINQAVQVLAADCTRKLMCIQQRNVNLQTHYK